MPQVQSATTQKTNFAFAVLFVVMVGYFVYWGLNYTQYHHMALFLIATLFGVFMAFNIGGNDVANSFGTSVGAGTLTVPQALLVAAIFEVSGAVIAGGEVTHTIRSGIVNLNSLPLQPLDLVFIMMSALLAAALWLLFATYKGLPVSTTHAIIGGIVGSSLALGYLISDRNTDPMNIVQWQQIGSITVSWILSPLLGGAVSYCLFTFIKKYILDYNHEMDRQLKEVKADKKQFKEEHTARLEALNEPERMAITAAIARDAQIYSDGDIESIDEFESEYYRRLYEFRLKKQNIDTHKALYSWVPLIAAFAGALMSSLLIFKGLQNVNLGMSTLNSTFVIIMIGAVIWLSTFIFAKTQTKKRKDLSKSTFLIFSWMQVVTAAGFAFSHGANDIANAIGPFAAIMDVLRTNDIGVAAPIPPVAMLTFGIALIVGLWFIGKQVIQTVGTNLAELHPSSGFTAELSAASVVMGASVMGLPVSSTHILVGAVLGIGLVNKNANWKMMKPIALAWIITLPAASILSIFSFFILRSIFG